MGSTLSTTATSPEGPAPAEAPAPVASAAVAEQASGPTTEAPVAEATPALAEAALPGAESAPAPEPTPEQSPEPEAEVFQLDDWDGEIENLPEEYRDVGGLFSKYFTGKHEAAAAELKALQDRAGDFESQKAIYEALMEGQDDPRIDALTTRIAEANVARDGTAEKLTALEADYTAYKAQVDAAETRYAEGLWDAFERQHPELAKQEDLVGELLTEGWALDEMVPLAALNDKASEAARALVKTEGLKPSIAIELATTRHPDQKERSRASVVAGSSRPGGNVSTLGRAGPLKESYTDRRERLIGLASNKY